MAVVVVVVVVGVGCGERCTSRPDESGGSGDGGDAAFGVALRARAAAWLPQLAAYEVAAVTHAERVMPEDGFPAVGWAPGLPSSGADGGASTGGAGAAGAAAGVAAGRGVYVCAAHSGVTLAPVLAAVAAAEVVDGVECELIDDAWRPARFA